MTDGCLDLHENGKNRDRDIAKLLSKGMNPLVQKALDVVRAIGNESVHPGTIDLNDNRDIAVRRFELVNLIVEQMITRPKMPMISMSNCLKAHYEEESSVTPKPRPRASSIGTNHSA